LTKEVSLGLGVWLSRHVRLYGHVTTLLLGINADGGSRRCGKEEIWTVAKSAEKTPAVIRMTTCFEPIPPKV
jgi:hypothetical protein